MSFRAAAIQFDSAFGQMEQNVSRLLTLCETAAEHGCRLIVLPEMATTGYCFGSRREMAALVEPIPGRTTARFAALAARYKCYVLVGMAEVDAATGQYYNSAALLGPSGLVGRMRKVHPDVWDSFRFRPGDQGFPVWETELGRIACQICMDACFPESSRIPALAGVDILCLPTAWGGELAPSGDWFTRAYENGAYLIAADRCGLEGTSEFVGGSCVIGPEGELLAYQLVGEGIVEADVDVASCAQSQRLAGRRPEFYADLVQARLPWSYRFARHAGSPGYLPAGTRFGVLVVQTGSIAPDPATAREQIARQVQQALEPGTQLVVLPELALAADPAQPQVTAEPLDGPTTQWAVGLCRAHGLVIALGLAEQDGDRLFNSALLVGPAGPLAVYRKLHLSASDKAWATPGNQGWQLCDLPIGRVGLMIGRDSLFPEAARCLALGEADLICVPSAVAGPAPVVVAPARDVAGEPSWHLWRVRAGENNCYVAFANRTDHGCCGASGIFGPDGYCRPRHEVMLGPEGPGAASLTVDTRAYLDAEQPNPTRTKDHLRMRRPELCLPLL